MSAKLLSAKLILRYSARALSVAVFGLVAAFVVGGEETMRPTAIEMLGLLFFPIGVLAGFVVSWRWEGAGALISLGSLAAFFAWLVARDGRLLSHPQWFLILSAPAFLFLLSAFLNPPPAWHGPGQVALPQ